VVDELVSVAPDMDWVDDCPPDVDEITNVKLDVLSHTLLVDNIVGDCKLVIDVSHLPDDVD